MSDPYFQYLFADRIGGAQYGKSTDKSPLLKYLTAGKASAAGEPTLYVCEGHTCQEPAKGAAAVAEEIKRLTAR